MVGQRPLEPLMKVRFLPPQPFDFHFVQISVSTSLGLVEKRKISKKLHWKLQTSFLAYWEYSIH